MTALVLAPPSYTSAIALSGGSKLWRKRVLPVGSIDYKGRQIHFTADYLRQLADAFHSRAYDQVPFQLAGDDNKHTNNVRNFGGEVVDFDVEPDGLYALVRPTEDGAAVLRSNPRLGISARIVEDYSRADGRHFPAAIQHCLGTLDPRLPGLGEWQQVDMSGGDVDQVIDLTNSPFEGDGDDLADLSELLADLAPEPWEVAAVDQALAYAHEAGLDADLSNGIAAIELAQELAAGEAETHRLEQQAALAQHHAASRARARLYAQAAVAEGDFHLAGRIHADLANDASATIDLAGDDGLSAARCGHDDGYGGCGSRYHAAGCIHNGLAEADAAGALPLGLSSAGVAMRNQIEAQSGIRLHPRESAFGPEPRAQELPRSSPFPRHVRDRAAQIAAQAGMPLASPDAARQRAIDRQVDAVANAALRGGNRARNLGDGPSFAQRREALRRPVSLQRVDGPADGLGGAVPGYTAGR